MSDKRATANSNRVQTVPLTAFVSSSGNSAALKKALVLLSDAEVLSNTVGERPAKLCRNALCVPQG